MKCVYEKILAENSETSAESGKDVEKTSSDVLPIKNNTDTDNKSTEDKVETGLVEAVFTDT